MESQHFKNLFQQILAINVRYQKINELTGENFNVFRILKVESAEVRMHSSFVAELLNPKGSHGQKDIFLKLFVKMFCFRQNIINTESCKVEVEKHTGRMNNERTEGGRIDILITDKSNNQIIIENKIYAADQQNQILRYFKHAPKADLIYLSLDGKEPAAYSKDILEAGKDYQCYSYKTHITEWLEACRKEVAVLPIIRESLTQYLNLVKYLTNQTLNDVMKDEVAVLLSANLEASFIISDNLDNALKIVLEKFCKQLEAIAEELGLYFVADIHDKFDKRYHGFMFGKEEWTKVGINFQFQAFDKDLRYGFSAQEDSKKLGWPLILDDDFKLEIKALGDPNQKENAWWPLQHKMEDPYSNWSKYEAWKAVDDETMAGVFREKIKHLLKISEGINL